MIGGRQSAASSETQFAGAKGMKILAAVVTYNRKKLLGRCIDHLQAQSRLPDQILIINNASTDGTEEMLKERGVFFITQENVGSAGGWRRSIQYAIDENYDAVWLMDDDGYPHKDALAKLEGAWGEGVVCASSVVLREDKPTHFVFPMPVLDKWGQPAIFAFPRKINTLNELRPMAHHGVYPYVQFFNGALVSVPTAREIGNVNHNYFMSGDEVDYSCRLTAAGRVISVIDAIQYHPDVSQRPFTPIKVYYYLKNTLILNSLYFKSAVLRNILTIGVVLARTVNRNGLGEAFAYVCGPHAPVFYLAIARGLQGKIGKDFVG
jgi:rhamnopyranosyl-N-acetylglucosaminyl-diphospho-decaprenol beta-1,3/1,4-galactofuranosyltransferase